LSDLVKGLIIGIFAGANIGVLVIGLLTAAKDPREKSEYND